MKYKVVIDPLAKQDIKELFFYVASSDSIPSAEKLIDTIEKTISKLEEYPDRGHIPQELSQTGIKKYLEIYYKSYRIIYEIDNKLVYVHCIIDGRRNIQEVLAERILR